jgi:hypothetical protein
LIQQLSEWDEAAQLAFCEDCAGRAEALVQRHPAGAEILADAIEPCSERRMVAAVGYWCALLAGESAAGRRSGPEYDAAFARERAAQAAWLRRELHLAS